MRFIGEREKGRKIGRHKVLPDPSEEWWVKGKRDQALLTFRRT